MLIREGAEGFVDPLDGQSHDVEVAAVELCHTDIAYPLLDAVGTCLVEGTVMGDVIVDFVVAQLLEGDVGQYGEGLLALRGCQRDARNNLMSVAAQLVEHAAGVSLVVGLAHHFVTQDDDGVGGNNEFVGGHGLTIGSGLLLRDILGNLAGG